MTRPRKTIDVESLKNAVNFKLQSKYIDQNLGETEASLFRRGLCDVIEYVLSDTGNYRGFAYLDKEYKEAIHGKVGYKDHREYRRVYY